MQPIDFYKWKVHKCIKKGVYTHKILCVMCYAVTGTMERLMATNKDIRCRGAWVKKLCLPSILGRQGKTPIERNIHLQYIKERERSQGKGNRLIFPWIIQTSIKVNAGAISHSWDRKMTDGENKHEYLFDFGYSLIITSPVTDTD